jgi:hypothetical protein
MRGLALKTQASVMAGLVPAIHAATGLVGLRNHLVGGNLCYILEPVLRASARMTGKSPVMTEPAPFRTCPCNIQRRS